MRQVRRRRRRRRRSSGPAEFLFAILLVLGLFVAVNQLWGHWVDLASLAPATASGAAPSTDDAVPALPPGSRRCQLEQRIYGGTKPGDVQEACLRAKAYARERVLAEWGPAEWACLDPLWDEESRWDAWVVNATSDAYGIPQILPGAHGHPPGTELGNWHGQIDWGLTYIKNRPDYRSPCPAYALWQSRSPHWY
jgi:hypothetical protein